MTRLLKLSSRLFLWLLIVVLIADLANLNDFLPGSECLHVEDAEILALADVEHDSFDQSTSQAIESTPPVLRGKPKKLIRDFDSPTILTSLCRYVTVGVLFTKAETSLPLISGLTSILYIEHCSFLI